jgi:hypothetical protein
VTISVPAAPAAAAMAEGDGNLPVPSSKREENSRPAMTSGSTVTFDSGMALPPPALTGSGSRVVAQSGHLSARSAELPCDAPA